MRNWAWAVSLLLGLLLVGYFISLLVRPNGAYSVWLDGWLVVGVEFVASVVCIARGLVREPGRAVALILGLALLSWCVGDFVLTVESLGGATPGTPSLADAFYLAFYPLAYAAVMLFVRGEARRLATPNWLDGLIAGLGAGSVCAAFVFRGLVSSAGSSTVATLTNLAYPAGDLLLLGLVVGGTALLGGRRKAPWVLLAGGLGLNAVGDTFNLFQSSFGSSYVGSTINAIAWPTAILVMSLAVWLRPRPSDPLASQRPTGFLLPELAGLSALAILFVGNLRQTNRAALGLSACTLLAVGIRLALSARTLRALSLERRRQSITDELTGLGNRRHLFQVLDAFFADQSVPGVPGRSVAFLFVDLNHFKEINDSFGHHAGDELLRQLGPRLTDVLRDSDLAVRLGGDEFAVLLIDGGTDYPTRIAERLAASIEQPFLLGSVEATIGASIGVASAPTDAADAADLMVCADVAMYRAKLSNARYAVFTHNLDQGGNGFSLAEELRTAIDEHQMVLHFQPQLDLRSGKVTAVEALVRCEHPSLGLLQPLTFLPLAEEASLMRSLTASILDQALMQCAAWRIAGSRVAVSVNISATNLLDPGFTGLIEEILDHHDLPPEALVLEITETSVIAEFDRSRLIIQQLQDLGLVVSIDDFGAGFTSLAYLNKLAIGELKLDRTFLADLTAKTREHDSDLIRATIALGHSLGLRIVAEGVEDAATLALLSDLQCDLAQGYFISRPVPAHELNVQSVGTELQKPLLALARTK